MMAFQSCFANSLPLILPRTKLVDNEKVMMIDDNDDDENKDAYYCGPMAVKGVRDDIVSDSSKDDHRQCSARCRRVSVASHAAVPGEAQVQAKRGGKTEEKENRIN
ncbi:hypothetical protein MA16_Dca023075 [Dendrobium catenatum]|uniref:Uncharacterized protein n=1 Tax=Dendrobium catenatum TaxID=906689 RepID=A0A2I0VHT6_9ASPA|nr:hypothetical protein MA16_Dca023075 [Dendrobium catenatum]